MIAKIIEIFVKIEEFAAKKYRVGESMKLVILPSAVLAFVAAVETLAENQVSLTGLSIEAVRDSYGPQAGSAIIFAAVVIGSQIFLLVGGAILHLFVLMFARGKKYSDTLPAMVSFLVPNLLLGWVPFANIWTSIYTFLIIVYVLAIKQGLTMAKATTAIALPIIIATVLALAAGGMNAGGMVQTLVPIPGN